MDMDAKQTVIAKLDELKINYTLIEHDPVYTIEEMEKIDIENIDYIVKNLFLRDAPPYASPAPVGGGGVCDSVGITCSGSCPKCR